VAQALNVHYKAEHADQPVVVTTAAQVRALLGSVRDTYPAGSAVLLTVVVADDPWKSELTVGVDGDKGVLHYAGEDTPPSGVYSRNPGPANPAPVLYYYVSADTEFPPDAEIPFPAVEEAVIEYLMTGARPTTVDWQ
jgi:hypothetical protein